MNITLAGGPNAQQGNVFVNGMPVCDDGWDLKDALVVCNQLGFPSVLRATESSEFGRVPTTFRMDDVECTGEETSLLECKHNRIDDCGSSEGAGVICDTTVELVGGDTTNVGNVLLNGSPIW